VRKSARALLTADVASLIAPMEQASGTKFYEAQVALARQWIGNVKHAGTGEPTPTEVTVWVPQDTADGIVITDPKAFTKETVAIPKDEAAARATIAQFETGGDAPGLGGAKDVKDSVAGHRMQAESSLLGEPWFGTADEELAASVHVFCVSADANICTLSYVSELVYVHAKVMIVDDRRVIVRHAIFRPDRC
jgi:phospholipase D1/2